MRKRLLYTALAAIATLAACKSTKYVNEGEYLLTDVDIDNLPRHISHEEAMRYVRQKPNVKILGFWRMNLNIYNLSGHDETKGINNWLRRIGEAPVVYDSTLCTRSAEQLTLFLRSKGYFDAQIRDTAVVRGRKKMKVVYRAEPGQLYRISRMAFTVDDDTMRPTVMADTARTLLHVGDPFVRRMRSPPSAPIGAALPVVASTRIRRQAKRIASVHSPRSPAASLWRRGV